MASDSGALRAALATTANGDPDTVHIDEADGDVTASVDGSWVGEWPSRTALAADIATDRVLAGTDWDALDTTARTDLAARVRGIAADCPACGEPTVVSEDTVTSCCREAEVVATTCPACDARLAEFEPVRDSFAAGR